MFMGILKKGQLQIQETILVIFIFTIIIILGMTLFFRFQEISLKNDIRDFKLKQFGNKILTLPDTSEFVYTEAGVKMNAVDTFKLITLKSLVEKEEDYYFEKYGYMNITVVQVYPEKINSECTKSKVDNCGVWKIYIKIPNTINSRLRKETPISLYFPEKNTFTIGILSVEVYNI